MNYIKHLSGFFDLVSEDWTLNPTHVSLYIALFHYWNINRFQNPISLTRDEVMRISKISSKATYHKCIKDLDNKGYIKYEPSNNPFRGSLATLIDFSESTGPVQKKACSPKKNLPNNELALNKQRTGSETSTETTNEQVLVSSINNTNNTNNSNFTNDLNLEEQAKNFEDENVIARNEAISEKNEKEKSSAKKEKENNPSIDEVKSYFLQQNFPELEANKFFNYFSSVGWLVGGKTPMVDWKPAAENWILNSIKFKSYEKLPNRAKHLNIENDKDYGEPL